MDGNKSEIMKKKKIRIIILLCIFGVLLMLLIGFGIGSLAYNLISENTEQKNGNVNTLSLEERIENKEDENVLKLEIEDPSPEEVVKPSSTPEPVDAPYYLKVNYKANVVTAYKKDGSGKYTVPVKAMICSCGTATPTSGVYPMTDKYTWRLLERKCIWTIRMQNYRINPFPLSTI